jgi:pimeloyl-ACP methyl ester carboxylesterase
MAAPVVALHGFPDGPASFEPLRAGLAARGHPLIAPYLPGHDRASIPRFREACRHKPVLDTAVDALLETLPAEPCHLVGHDWGAILGALLAHRHPDRFRTFTALAIPPLTAPAALLGAHPTGLLRFWYIALFQVPHLGERLIADPRFIAGLVRRWSPGFALSPAQRDDVTRRYRDPALASAALAYYRALRSPESWRRLTTAKPHLKVPTLVLYGDRDGCFPPQSFPTTLAHAPGITLRALPGLGHWLHGEDPAAVLAELTPWFR